MTLFPHPSGPSLNGQSRRRCFSQILDVMVTAVESLPGRASTWEARTALQLQKERGLLPKVTHDAACRRVCAPCLAEGVRLGARWAGQRLWRHRGSGQTPGAATCESVTVDNKGSDPSKPQLSLE